MVLPNSNYSCQSLVDLLEHRATTSPDIIAYRYLLDDFGNTKTITYKMLAIQARAVAVMLQQQGAVGGERALLIYPPGIDLIVSFFGCLYAGVIAVPVYPPTEKVAIEKFQHIIKDSEPRFLLCVIEDIPKYRNINLIKKIANIKLIKRFAKKYLSKKVSLSECNLESFVWIATNDISLSIADNYNPLIIQSDKLAFLQYTSGSTDHPKGVMVSHGNLLQNLNLMYKDHPTTSGSTMVYWLPPYHDLGLISGILFSIYRCSQSVFLSPAHFVRNPYAWLKAISDYRADLSMAPNFAYDYCVNKITNDQLSLLNLSDWRMAVIGAEPIYAETLNLFYNKFKQCGFQMDAFRPCYGLAEATIYVSGYNQNQVPTILNVSKNELKNNRIKYVEEGNTYSLVSCGKLQQEVKIVNPDTFQVCTDSIIGEVWVHGPCVASGYWKREAESKVIFGGKIQNDVSNKTYLRTGDFGFVLDGELFITGRLKDLIIIHGINYYPHDIELTVWKSDSSIRRGCCTAFSINIGSQEKLVIITELKKNIKLSKVAYQNICQVIAKNILINHELSVHAIVLIPAGTLPKTTSGKIRRKYSKTLFENNEFKALYKWTLIDGEMSEVSRTQSNLDENKKNELLELIVTDVIFLLSAILKIDKSNISATQNLSDLQLSSISVIEYSEAIATLYKIQFSPAILFEHSNILNFSKYLYLTYGDKIQEYYFKPAQTKDDQKSPENGSMNNNVKTTVNSTEVAIIGMSGIFPGADNLIEFWANLENGKDCINEIPIERWDWRTYQGDKKTDNKTNIKWGGFINGIDQFDADFFHITPREAAVMDPQQRLFLKVAWQALESSGYSREKLSEYMTGVFVGVSNNDYLELLQKNNEMSAHSTTGNSHSVLANRVSYFFDIHGPSEAIDTACSSSLVAIHNAVQSIRHGECQMAIAGGVNALLTPTLYIAFDKAGMLSSDGKCKTFDKSANGYVRSEGAAAIILKSLELAIRDNDTIYGVIKGSAVNHCGHLNSLTVPNPHAQAEVIKKAIIESKIDVESISYIETHGTGTSLGDPIEINGLKKAFNYFSDNTNKHPHCGLGALKSIIGHMEAAAGIASVIKVLLSLNHKKLPGNLHFNELNPYIELKDSPFYILEQTDIWPNQKDPNGNDIPHRAGVSAFGFGGTNAHIIIEEYVNNNKALSIPAHIFNETRHWYKNNNTTNVRPQYNSIFSQENNNAGDGNEIIFTKELDREVFYLNDHIVGNEAILPAVVYLEMVCSAADIVFNTIEIEIFDIVWLIPIKVEKSKIKVYFLLKMGEESSKFEIYTKSNNSSVIHCQGLMRIEGNKKTNTLLDLSLIKERCKQHINKSEIYKKFDSVGLHYGQSFQAMKQLLYNDMESLAEIQLSSERINTLNSYILQPSILDAALGAALGFYVKYDHPPLLIPFSLKSIRIISKPESQIYAYAVMSEIDSLGTFDVKIANDSGLVHIIIKEYLIKEYKSFLSPKSLYLYRPVWKEQIVQIDIDMFALNSTIIFYNSNKIRDSLQSKYKNIVWVKQGAGYKAISNTDYEINPDRKEDYKKLFEHLLNKKVLTFYLINTFYMLNDETQSIFYQQLYLLQSLVKATPEKVIKYVFVYTNYSLNRTPLCESLSGFFNSIKTVKSSASFVSVSLDESTSHNPDMMNLIVNELTLKQGGFREVSYVNGIRYCRCFVEINKNEYRNLNKKTKLISSNKTYLITGGSGALGQIFAEYLVDQYKSNIILVGRRSVNESIKAFINKLALKGCHCEYITADITLLADVEELLQKIKSLFGSLNGIIHAAGVADDTLFTDVSDKNFSNILAPKIQGTINIDLATQNEPLDFFLLFSSVSSELGDFGAASYAIANRFLDDYALFRESLVLNGLKNGKTISINWPYWEQGGMRIPDHLIPLYFNYSGLKGISNEIGVSAFELIMSLPYPQVVVGYGDKSKIDHAFHVASIVHTIDEVEPSVVDQSDLTGQLVNYLKAQLAEISGLALSSIDGHRNFEEYGIDSIMVIDFNSKISQIIPNIPNNLLLEHKTLNTLATYLVGNYSLELKNILNIDIKLSSKNDEIQNVSLTAENTKPITTQLSLNQERLWFIYRYNPDDTTYNVGMAIHFDGTLNEEDLRNAAQEIIVRHQALRMLFSDVNGKPVAVIQDSPKFFYNNIDFYDISENEFSELSKIEFNKELKKPIYLDKGPLIRHTLLRSKNSYTLLICTHHIVFDGWSFFLYMKTLSEYYNLSHRNTEYPKNNTKITYIDYINEQRERIKGQFLLETISFWKDKLCNVNPIKFPLDFYRENAKHKMEVYEFSIPNDLSVQLKDFCQKIVLLYLQFYLLLIVH